ncbi:FAS-associated factor 1-like isoform X2 [Watersipora subatra]|uniref:FAS-associated factor 1-like isoform X2 n=1 Tax=Watersipora subatra TaxID=2589382 RepID=UPI00355BCC8F
MDTDTDRSQILADFQACANVDDIEHALAVLEASDWNLMEAVNMVLATNDSERIAEEVPNMRVNGRGLDVPPSGLSFTEVNSFQPSAEPAASLTRTIFNRQSDDARSIEDELGINRRLIKFHVQYSDELIDLELRDSDTVEELNDRLATRIDKDKSQFTVDWPKSVGRVENNYTLSELKLPRENKLRLTLVTEPTACTVPTRGSSASTSNVMPSDGPLFRLIIDVTYSAHKCTRKEMTEPGTRTVGEIKESIAKSCHIATSAQSWSGWPPYATDNYALNACQLSTPIHILSVCLAESSQSSLSGSSAREGSQEAPYKVSDSESDHDYDMMSDDHDIDIMEMSRQPVASAHMIPRDMVDPKEATSHFNKEFVRRYGGHSKPLFYEGSFKEVTDNALQCPAADRRLLAVYLHHDESIAVNVFCAQVLCSETVSTYLNNNFVTWGWDLTLEANKNRFVEMFEVVVGKQATDVVKHLSTDKLPVLVILAKVRGSLEILSMPDSNVTQEEMMTTLLHAEDVFEQSRHQDIVEEEERKSREEMKRLQDAAYEESLAIDRVKQQQLRMEQAEKSKLEQEEIEARRLEEETMEAIKQSVAETIPDEPPEDCAEVMARLRFRCPEGAMLNRRFLGETKLKVLFNYLVTEGYNTAYFKVLTTFPRRDLTQEDDSKTLDELELCPQETLILESKLT